jgi:tetratricopeptide (TPR) repeat protein
VVVEGEKDVKKREGCLYMKHVPQDKYNVAWFTLAECVSRGEKVRALGVYRLLSHSIEDIAFRRQLEADILLSFQDNDEAVAKYKEAANLYKKSGKYLEAVAVYEHLKQLGPNNTEYLNPLIELYTLLHITTKVVVYLKQLFEAQLHGHDFGAAEDTLISLDNVQDSAQNASCHQQITFALIADELHDKKQVLSHIKRAVQGFLRGDDNRALQKFLSTLEAMDQDYAKEAYRYAQEDNLL